MINMLIKNVFRFFFCKPKNWRKGLKDKLELLPYVSGGSSMSIVRHAAHADDMVAYMLAHCCGHSAEPLVGTVWRRDIWCAEGR